MFFSLPLSSFSIPLSSFSIQLSRILIQGWDSRMFMCITTYIMSVFEYFKTCYVWLKDVALEILPLQDMAVKTSFGSYPCNPMVSHNRPYNSNRPYMVTGLIYKAGWHLLVAGR